MSKEIQKNCLSCPMVCNMQDSLRQLNQQEDELIQQSMSAELDEVAGESKKILYVGNREAVDVPTLDGVSGLIRTVIERKREQVRSNIGAVEEILENATVGCMGPAVLKAVLDGVAYESSICRAPMMDAEYDAVVGLEGTAGAPRLETALVTRTNVE